MPKLRPWLGSLVALGNQTMPGNDLNLALKFSGLQRDGEVDAGKSGADQKHAAIWIEPFERGRRPCKRNIFLTRPSQAADFRVAGRKIANRENHNLQLATRGHFSAERPDDCPHG